MTDNHPLTLPSQRRWLPVLSLAYVSAAWVAGVYLGSVLRAPPFAFAAAIAPLAAIPFLPTSRRPALVVASLCLLAVVGGAARLAAADAIPNNSSISQFNGGPAIMLRGVLTQDPEIRHGSATAAFSANSVSAGGAWNDAGGRILLNMRPYPEFHKGDSVEISGKLKEPPSGAGYGSYLLRQGIVSVMDYPRVTLLGSAAKGPSLWLQQLRSRLSNAISSTLPEPQASLGKAILLGERTEIPDDLNRAFSRTGTMHLLSISGMNLTIAAGLLLFLAVRALGRRRFLYVWVAMAGVWAYTLLTGAYPPVLRAAVMASVFLLAEHFGRQKSAIVAIVIAAAVMVAIDPHVLWSVSFQLSFISMLGLILLVPFLLAQSQAVTDRLEAHRTIQRCADFVAGSFAVTLGTFLATWPLLAHYFGMVSSVSLLANLAIVSTLPVIMVSTAAAASVGLITGAATWAAGWAAWPFLTYMIDAVRLFDRFPYASSKIGPIPAWAMVTYYGLLATALWLPSVPRLRKVITWRWTRATPHGTRPPAGPVVRYAVTACVLLLGAAWFTWSAVGSLPDNKLHVSFLDVGNGDAALISTPDGRRILIDGGPDPQVLGQQLAARIPFWDREIDLVVLSHPHADHLTGLVSVLEGYRVKRVLESGEPYDSQTYRQWQQLIVNKGIPVWTAETGQTVNLEKGRLSILHASHMAGAEPDQSVVVLRLEWGNVSFLLTGDAGHETEREMLSDRTAITSTVLKVGHHGSSTSTSAEFLAVARPQIAVISVGAYNPYGMPAPQVTERIGQLAGDHVLTTAEHGAIEVDTDGERIWVETER